MVTELQRSICALPLALALLAAAMSSGCNLTNKKGYHHIVLIHLGYNATSQQLSEYKKTELLLNCVIQRKWKRGIEAQVKVYD